MENTSNGTNGKPTTHVPTKRIKFPALSQSQFYTLAEWVKANRAGLTETRPTFAAVALTASGALGFNVKGSDIANAANATGVAWTPIKPPTSTSGRGFDKPVRRQARDTNIATLANAVRELYAKLGEPLPDGFEDGVRTHVPQAATADAPPTPTPEQLDAAADATRHAHRVAAINPEAAPKVGDAGRPKLPAPPVYASEVGRTPPPLKTSLNGAWQPRR
jgi:hypothetical protein